jgi:hypothetical protein
VNAGVIGSRAVVDAAIARARVGCVGEGGGELPIESELSERLLNVAGVRDGVELKRCWNASDDVIG